MSIADDCREFAKLVREWDAYEPGKPGPPQKIDYPAEAALFDKAADEIERLRGALEMIAGRRQCVDTLLSNVRISELALDHPKQ